MVINVVSVSGEHFYAESGVYVASGLGVVGNFVASVSGQPVTISGNHVFVESGVYFASGIWVQGAFTAQVSGQPVTISGGHVFVESGVNVVGGVLVSGTVYVVNPILGQGPSVIPLVVTASGNHVFVESGVYLASGIFGQVDVYVKGIVWDGTVSISGQPITISGDHVYVESGVYLASGLYVVTGGGSGAYGASGQSVIVQSGLGVSISGQHVYVESGLWIAGSGMIALAWDTDLAAYGPLVMNGGYLYVDITGQSVNINSIGVNSSGLLYLGSGQRVVIQSGVVVASGLGVLISGQHVYVESGVIVASGLGVVLQTVPVDGAQCVPVVLYDINGDIWSVASGLGVSISGQHVYVESGTGVVIQSGVYTIGGGSGTYAASGVGVIINSGVGVTTQSGVYLATPTTILTNATVNPAVVGNVSGGIILTSGVILSVIVKAVATNSGAIYLGGHTAGHMPFSGGGFVLDQGEGVNLDINQLGHVHAFACVSGDLVSYIANA